MSKGKTDTPPAGMSDREWIRQSRQADYNEEMAEEIAGHLDEGPIAPESPHPRRREGKRAGGPIHAHGDPDRLERSETKGEQHREPAAGHETGVPTRRDALPGTHHYNAHEAVRGHPPLDVGPASPYYSGGMAHGVYAPPQHGGRPAPHHAERTMHEANVQALEHPEKTDHDPVAVYLVDDPGSGSKPLRRTSFQKKTVNASGGELIRIVGKDPHRHAVRLLNETSTAIRMTFDPGNPSMGAMLPASMSNYLEIKTQDDIWAIADSGNAGLAVSIISEYNVPGGH